MNFATKEARDAAVSTGMTDGMEMSYADASTRCSQNSREAEMVRTMQKAQVSLPSDTEVRVTRDFNAPRTLVWDAHTKPELRPPLDARPAGLVDAGLRHGCAPGRQVSLALALRRKRRRVRLLRRLREVEAPAKMSHDEYYDPGDVGGAMDMPPARHHPTPLFTEANGITTLEMIMTFATRTSATPPSPPA